jgi:hypothetical protein
VQGHAAGLAAVQKGVIEISGGVLQSKTFHTYNLVKMRRVRREISTSNFTAPRHSNWDNLIQSMQRISCESTKVLIRPGQRDVCEKKKRIFASAGALA